MKLQSKPAYSLIFAFVVITVMLLVAAGTVQNIDDTISFYRNLDGGAKAYLAAQSAAEMGVLDMKQFHPGYENASSEKAFSVDSDGDGTPETYGHYRIFAKTEPNADESDPNLTFLPLPGTGTARYSSDCAVRDDDDNGIFDYLSSPDDSCNWNKMLYGDSVTIPLYSDDGHGNLAFPADLGLTSWKLRVRTPCDPSIPGNDINDALFCERYSLDSGSGYSTDDTVIFWQITGKGVDSGGKEYTVSVVPDDIFQTTKGSTTRKTDKNTEVYESLINTHNKPLDYVVLPVDSSDHYKAIYDACMDAGLTDLTLQMNIATPLKQALSGESIPYLEWQLEFVSDSPFASNQSWIVGEGYHPGFGQTFYSPFTVIRSTIGKNSNVYTLSN